MLNNHEKKFIITRQQGSKVEVLKHDGCKHLWTSDRSLAMVYTKTDVADALADKMGGEVNAAGAND